MARKWERAPARSAPERRAARARLTEIYGVHEASLGKPGSAISRMLSSRLAADDPGAMKELLIVGRGGEGVSRIQVLAETFARVGILGAELPGVQGRAARERRSRPTCAGTARPSTAATSCRRATCSSRWRRSLRMPRCAPSGRGGVVLVNRENRLALAGPFELARVPATRIARERGILSAEGRPMANAALLGACVQAAPSGRHRAARGRDPRAVRRRPRRTEHRRGPRRLRAVHGAASPRGRS